MSFRRVGWLAATVLSTFLWMSCGEVYRPVVIPVSTNPPNPSGFHAVFGLSTNVPFNFGTALQIDVSGDTTIGVANMGLNPTHAAVLPNNSRVFVASAGSVNPDGTANLSGADLVSAFTPATDSSTATGLGNPSVFSLPNFGPTNPNTGGPSFICSYQPDFLTTTQATAIYLANFGVEGDPNCNLPSTDSVAVLSASQNSITTIAYLPAGSHPVALAETPDAQHLFVVNQGNNTVTHISPLDMSTIATIPVGNTPVWAVARADNQRVYVVTQGDGQLFTINTGTNAVSNQAVGGAGANFILYDKNRNRLYVTNPVAANVYVFDATPDSPTLLATISMTSGANAPCPNGCFPVSVTALADGSRFYVASYELEGPAVGTACPDSNLPATSDCLIPRLTVFDARSLALKPIPSSLSPSIALLSSPQFPTTQTAVPIASSCASTGAYRPGTTRFRMFTSASADSSHVYVSICDGGMIADVNATTSNISTGGTNSPDTLMLDLTAPFSAAPAGANGEPPPQNPIFLLAGQ